VLLDDRPRFNGTKGSEEFDDLSKWNMVFVPNG